jgi:hypothetical protein
MSYLFPISSSFVSRFCIFGHNSSAGVIFWFGWLGFVTRWLHLRAAWQSTGSHQFWKPKMSCYTYVRSLSLSLSLMRYMQIFVLINSVSTSRREKLASDCSWFLKGGQKSTEKLCKMKGILSLRLFYIWNRHNTMFPLSSLHVHLCSIESTTITLNFSVNLFSLCCGLMAFGCCQIGNLPQYEQLYILVLRFNMHMQRLTEL